VVEKGGDGVAMKEFLFNFIFPVIVLLLAVIAFWFLLKE